MNNYCKILFTVLISILSVLPAESVANTGVVNTRHNLSASGPGEIRSLSETRVCIFCHTPHNSTPRTPLWNKALEPISYVLYTSTTMGATPSQPSGPSRLCLSCHDGTLALGVLLKPETPISMTGEISPGRLSYLGTVLTGDHPFSFSYQDSLGNPLAGLSPVMSPDLLFYDNGFIHCSTCHDAHEDAFQSPDINGQFTGKFLVMDNRYSALCTECHSEIDGWLGGTHKNTSGIRPVTGVLPVPPKKWPAWESVREWGCESCHTSHSAGSQRLQYFPEEEENCFLCHNGMIAIKDIKGQFQKMSKHPVESMTGVHDPNEPPDFITDRHVECSDCHNPHSANRRQASPPYASGSIEKVKGVDVNRTAVDPVAFEYEICFKCHADLAPQMPFIPRVVNTTNKRLAFDPANPSFHPVVQSGSNPNVPSIPSSFEPALSVSSVIYCTACHSDDGGVSNGPHGSSYAPILKERYETIDFTPESFQNYALCYTCHDRTSILNDQSFNRHFEHIVQRNTPCSICHDAHGIADDGFSGSHTHLINFDTRIVSPASGNQFPIFTDTGTYSGNCTLVCHGRTHINESYP